MNFDQGQINLLKFADEALKSDHGLLYTSFQSQVLFKTKQLRVQTGVSSWEFFRISRSPNVTAKQAMIYRKIPKTFGRTYQTVLEAALVALEWCEHSNFPINKIFIGPEPGRNSWLLLSHIFESMMATLITDPYMNKVKNQIIKNMYESDEKFMDVMSLPQPFLGEIQHFHNESILKESVEMIAKRSSNKNYGAW